MRVVHPLKTQLSDILLLDPILDGYIDPYRHRKDLMIEIGISEYIEFIQETLRVRDYMFTPTAKLKEMVASDNRIEIYRNYVIDVAFAGIKEVILAERRGADATTIVYVTPPDAKKIEGLKPTPQNIWQKLVLRRLALLRYDMPEIIQNFHNREVLASSYASLWAALAEPGFIFRVR